jgi:predicted extracellular nuclease
VHVPILLDPTLREAAVRFATTCCALALTLAAGTTAARAAVVINEVDYDQPGGFDAAEFIELKNTGATSVNLSGWTLELVNGNLGGAAIYLTVPLPAATVAPGGYFVVSFGSAYPWWTNDQFNLVDSSIQNGPPDAIALRDGLGTMADVVSYAGTSGAPYFEGTGTPLDDDNVTPNIGLSRYPDGADTNDNGADFSIRCITPGAPNSAGAGGCGLPVPAAASTWGAIKQIYR